MDALDEAARGFVFFQPAEQLGRHAPVGALRAVLIDDVEEHEFAFGVGSRFFRHDRVPIEKRKTPRKRGVSPVVACLDGLQIRGSGLAAARIGLHI